MGFNCILGQLDSLYALNLAESIYSVFFLFSPVTSLTAFNIIWQHLHFQIGKVSKAFEVSKMMETAGIKHNMKTYSMLINGFLKLKDWANVFAVMEDLVKDGLKPDVVLYNNIITAFCGMGNMDRAVRTIKEMQRGRHRPTSRTFMPIIHGFARAGEMRRALEIFDMMRMSGCIPTVHTFNSLVLGLVEKRQVNILEIYNV